jgi:hypothetical protein
LPTPYCKYKGQPLITVAKDASYYRRFQGSLYARMNPELAADLAALANAPAAGSAPIAAVERSLYRPATWCVTS